MRKILIDEVVARSVLELLESAHVATNLLWIRNDCCEVLREALAEQPDRQALQAAGTHPAPCARHCEAQAFEIAARGMRRQIAELQAALAEQPAPQEPVALEPERKAFEEWIDSGFINKGHAAFHKFSDRDAYCIDEIQNKWKAWEERAKRTTPQAQPAPEIAIADAYRAGVDSGISAEREACAKVVEDFARKWWKIHCDSNKHLETTLKAHQDFCALQAAIRARGNPQAPKENQS